MAKIPTSIEEQISIFKERKLIIEDEDSAKEFLIRVNYYRLAGYTHFFCDKKNGSVFNPNTTFDKLKNIYELDEEIRYILFKYITKIEIAFKAQLSYELAHVLGPTGYLNFSSKVFENENKHISFLEKLDKQVKKNSSLPFIDHHIKNYNSEFPIWVTTEILTFLQIALFYKNLQPKYAQLIEKHYDSVSNSALKTWFLCLSSARNICAHHGRIYRSSNSIQPISANSIYKFGHHSIYSVFHLVGILLHINSKEDDAKAYVDELLNLNDRYQNVNFKHTYDFMKDWEMQLQGYC